MALGRKGASKANPTFPCQEVLLFPAAVIRASVLSFQGRQEQTTFLAFGPESQLSDSCTVIFPCGLC